MNNIRTALLALVFVCLLSISALADNEPLVCKDGQTPIGNRCPNGFAPTVSPENEGEGDSTKLLSFEDFLKYFESWF